MHHSFQGSLAALQFVNRKSVFHPCFIRGSCSKQEVIKLQILTRENNPSRVHIHRHTLTDIRATAFYRSGSLSSGD